MLRIAITDDHQLFRKSLKLLVNSFGDMEVVLEAAHGKELLEKLKTTPVDVLLLDLQMSEMDGFATVPEVNNHYPEIKIMVLTLLNEQDTIKRVMELGAQGYFTKNTNPNELKNAILKINNHGFYFEGKLNAIIETILNNPSAEKTQEPAFFSEREMEIVQLTVQEYSGMQIADKLNISPRTVEKHKRNLMEKTNSKNFIGVIVHALHHGFLPLKSLKTPD